MNRYLKGLVKYPLVRVTVRVGLGGLHYHLPDCTILKDTLERTGERTGQPKIPHIADDYVSVELPEEWVSCRVSVPLFGRIYLPCLMCLDRLRNTSERVISEQPDEVS